VNPALFRHAVSFFASYVIDHFAAEEAAMADTRYSGARFHKDLHDRLRRECAAIVAHSKRKGMCKVIKLSIYFMLEDWLIYHIRETDHELAGFLRDHSPGATILHLPDVRTVRESGVIPSGFDESTFEDAVGQRQATAIPSRSRPAAFPPSTTLISSPLRMKAAIAGMATQWLSWVS